MDMKTANAMFVKGAAEVFFGNGLFWQKEVPTDFDADNHEYMRTIKDRDNTYMLAIDLDATIGMNEKLLECAKELHAYFYKRGILKASGLKGVHVIPYKVRFPPTTPDYLCLEMLADIAYSAFKSSNIEKRFGFPFLKRTKDTPEDLIEYGYIDTSMFTRARKIRGFCRRFDQNGKKLRAWSVPISPTDTIEDVFAKTTRSLEPDWRIDLGTVDFSPKLISHRLPKKRGSGKTFKNDLKLEKGDNLKTIMDKLLEEMPDRLVEVWNSDDPSHPEKFAAVCWLNNVLQKTVPDSGKRADLITNLVVEFMALNSYRASGRFSPSIITYQVDHIVLNDYYPPKWIWESDSNE